MATPTGSDERETIWEGDVGGTYVGIWTRGKKLAFRVKGTRLYGGPFDYKEVYEFPDINSLVAVCEKMINYIRYAGAR